MQRKSKNLVWTLRTTLHCLQMTNQVPRSKARQSSPPIAPAHRATPQRSWISTQQCLLKVRMN